MAYIRHLIPELNFVFTRATGIVDDASLVIHLMSLRIECKKYRIIRELVDLRDIRDDKKITVRGLIKIANTHKNLFKKEYLSAVLVRTHSTQKMIEFYATLVANPTFQMEIFSDSTDSPLTWLGYDHVDIDRIKGVIGKYYRQ